jgi:hypothetical protein
MRWFRRRRQREEDTDAIIYTMLTDVFNEDADETPCPNDHNHEYNGKPCPVCGGSMTLKERNELLRLSAESNRRALENTRSRGYEHITDDPKYEDFFVGCD